MEGEAAGRIIDLATLVGTPLYIFHVSCGQVVERIAAARSRGLPIYGETCPQYLFLSDELFERPGVAGALPVCSPPIRTEAQQAKLWEALVRDQLQVVSTDHCPFTGADKATGLGDYSRIPGGVPSIEARFPLLYSAGVRGGRFSANRWVDICCTTPAKLFGLEHKGHIAVGYEADLVIFDPEIRRALSTETLHEKVDWTLYDGMEVTGWPAITISRGSVLVENGKFLGQAGQGRFVARRLTL
jgi:dihydropyrimidinase